MDTCMAITACSVRTRSTSRRSGCLWWSRGLAYRGNETRDQLVNNLDVAATIQEAAGVKPGTAPDGRSLLPILHDAKAPWRSAILVEGGNGVTKADKRYAAVRTATRKYVRHDDGLEELYDLVADPYELDNKVKDPPAMRPM